MFEEAVTTLEPIEVTDTPIMDVKDIPTLSEAAKVKKDELFYAVATESYDPITDWKKANEELVRTGESSLYRLAQEKWMKEQDDSAKAIITGVMLDITVPDYQKKAAINSYLAGSYISSSMKEKYLMKQASMDTAITDMDRKAQDILAESVYQRDGKKQEEEAKRLIEQADIDFSSALKGTGAVASQIALSIPAGYAAIYSLLKEQDPEKAAEVMQAVQEYGYMPDEAGAQKVISKIQSFMDFIDIPFKWLGDKTLEFTDSPGAATAVYTGTSMAGYIGAYKAGKALVKGVRKGSPADVTATANRPNATELGAAAVADTTGQVASALGTTREALIADWTLTKLTDDLADRPDLVAALEKQDRILSGLYEETRIDPNIYPVSKILEEKEAYLAVMQETTGPRLLTSRSVLDFEWTEASSYLKGKALFGRNENYGYNTELAAEYAAEQLRQNTARLPEAGEVSVVKRGDEHFIQWEFKRPYDPLEHLTFGPSALKANILGLGRDGIKSTFKDIEITRGANSVLGEWVWPAFMRMKSWLPSIGAMSGWKQARIEQAFLTAQRDLVHKTPHTTELNTLLRDGETEGKVWNIGEVRAKYPHLKEKEVQDLFASYYGYRRIEDHLYKVSDRKFRYSLEKDDYETLYSPTGERLGFASSKIPTDTPIKKVWDFETRSVKEISPVYSQEKQLLGYDFSDVDKKLRSPVIQLVKLHDAVKVGDNLYNYANLSRNQLGPIQPGSLNRIPGYVSRQYKEWFVVEKQPKKLEVDGNKIGEVELRQYRSAAGMEKTKVDANLLKARFEAEDPNHTYHVRAERKDIEDKVIFDSKIYDSYFKEHQKRGGKLPGLNRQTDIEDVLVSQTKAIMTMSRLEAFGSYMEHARKEFVKDYGKFTGYKFPESISDISARGMRLDKGEEAQLLAAQKIYKQLELQQYSTLLSDEIWKGGMGAIADAMEHSALTKVASSVFREIGEKGMLPVKVAKALGSHMWLYMRPQRMWIVQPQQFLELSTISPTFLKQALNDLGPIFAGLLSRAKTMEKLQPYWDAVGRRGVKEYDAIIDALTKTGIMQAVDTNQMIHGIWKDTLEELVPSKVTKVIQTTKKGVLLPSRIGRSIGYDPSELMNQLILWMFSKNKWQAENPGKVWNTPENIAEIGQLTWRMGHGASTRAGLMPMQEGVLSMLAQFIAIPHKSFMQMLSSPDLTPNDRAKLFGARMFWYGKWGIPGGAALYGIMEQYMPDETAENLDKYTRGASDYIMNESLSYITGEKTDSFWSKSTATVPETLFVFDAINTLVDMSDGKADANHKAPFVNATASLFLAANDLWDMYNIPVLRGDEPDWELITQKGVEFYLGWGSGSVKDIGKALMAEQITKTGQNLGRAKTAGERINQLFGVPTAYESITWDALKVKGKREKFIDETAKEIHDRAMRAKINGASELKDYWKDVSAFIRTMPEEYHDDLVVASQKWDRTSQTDIGDSLAIYLLNNYTTQNDGYMQELRNKLNSTNDPRLKQVNEVLK